MSFFSLTLLIHNVYKIEGRLAPGLCPYRNVPSIQDIGKIKELFLSELSLSLEDQVQFIYSEQLPEITDYYEDTNGYLPNDKYIEFYNLYK
jgi:hypothetical protein